MGGQLLGVWRQLGLNQRLSLVLAGLLAVGTLAGVLAWSSRVEYSLLYGRLDDAEGAKVIAALNDAKVPFRTGAGGAIYVPAGKLHAMRMQLAGKGIPRGEGVGFEILDKPNFGISDFVQRANYTRAVQGELARTVAQLDEVESARVMITMPENRLLLDQSKRPTASVFVKTRGANPLPASAVNSIRFLVANAVEGLQANRVTVVDNRGNVLSENTEEDSLAGLTTTQLSARRNVERYLARKAEEMLEKVLGPGQAVVRVSADINFDTSTRTEEKFDADAQAVKSTMINDETTDSTTASAGGGVAGVTTNGNADTNAVAGSSSPLTTSATKKKVTNNQYEIPRTTSSLTQAAGGIKRLSAAVFVAARFSGTGTNRVVAPRTPEELQKLRRIVQNAVGLQEGEGTRKDEIALEEMAFNDGGGAEWTAQLEKDQRRQFWIEAAQRSVYPALALAVLVLFWRALKRTAVEGLPVGVPVGALGGNGNGNGNGHGNGHDTPERKAKGEPGLLTVEALNQLVRENPGNMSQAIRAWMARGRANPAD